MDLSKHLEKAREAVKRKNYAFAVNLYGQLLGLQPDNADARAGLRDALFRKAAAKKPSKFFALLGGGVHLITAKLMGALRQPKAAASAYERYLKLDPLDEGSNLALAASLERAGYANSALAVYRAWAEHQPRSLEASREAGRLLYEQGELQDALAMYEQALKVDPRDQDALRARKNLAAEGALKQTGIESAKSSRDLVKDKDQQRQLERQARRHLTPEEIDEEIASLEGRLDSSADDAPRLARLAELHRMRRDPQTALDCLEAALALRPDDGELVAQAGDLRIQVQEQRVADAEQRGDEAAAENARRVLNEMRAAEFKRRVERQPSDLGLRFELGTALLAAGRADDAIPELQQAIKDPRRAVTARLALGRAFHGKGLTDLARGQLEQALESGGGATGQHGKEILYELGRIAEDAGDAAAATRHFESILEQDYGYRDVATRLDGLRQAGA